MAGRSRRTSGCTGAGADMCSSFNQRRRAGPVNRGVGRAQAISSIKHTTTRRAIGRLLTADVRCDALNGGCVPLLPPRVAPDSC